MGFLKPKAPQVVTAPEAAAAATPANAAVTADAGINPSASATVNPGSLISTSAQGLTRKAATQKPSLIGGSGSAN